MSEFRSQRITVNQTLHGYKGGHTLLFSSCDIDTETKRMLLVMSDMSGASIVSGFEEYYTGYPLPQMSSYALGKTWYAPEMSRPGCVWTQTLIIDFSDLAKLSNPMLLLELFRRPNLDLEDTSYGKPVSYLEENKDYKLSSLHRKELAKTILQDLYEDPLLPVLLKSVKSSFYEDLIFRIWFQQWPRLRRNFTFCTGAIEPRKIKGKFLDLQVVPENLKGMGQNEKIVSPKLLKENIFPDWVHAAADDLQGVSDFNLSRLLFEFGVDIAADRSSFKPLIETILFLYASNTDRTTETVLDIFSKNFPSPQEGVSLKQRIFGITKSEFAIDNFPEYSETEILRALSTWSNILPFDYAKLQYEQRLIDLFILSKDGYYNLLNTLIGREVNIYGQREFERAASDINVNDLTFLNKNYPHLLLTFALLNKEIVYNQSFWHKTQPRIDETISSLQRHYALGDFDWKKIVEILYDLDYEISTDVFLKDINISRYILEIVNSPNKILKENWLSILKQNPLTILEWLNTQVEVTNEKLLQSILDILNPNASEVIRYGSKIWSPALYKKWEKHETTKKLSAFLLALSLNLSGQDGAKLLLNSIATVYDALAIDQLDYRSWSRLERHTRPLNILNDWDKCRKLIIAVVETFPQFSEMKPKLFDFHPNEIFRKALEKYKTQIR